MRSTVLHDVQRVDSAAGSALDGAPVNAFVACGTWTLETATYEFKTDRRLAAKIAGPQHASLNLAEYVSYIHADDLRLELPENENDVTVEFRIFTFDGRMRWFRTHRQATRGDGRVTHVRGLVQDITEQRASRDELETETSIDPLTRAKNRRAFDLAIERGFEDVAVSAPLGAMLVDLDGFRSLNERYGTAAGDEILREVGRRLGGLLRPDEMLARIGGDEFALVTQDGSDARLDGLSAGIARVFAVPFETGSATLAVAANCGRASRLPVDRSVGEMVERAEHALRTVKRARPRGDR